jgi:6-phosphogluconolactonase
MKKFTRRSCLMGLAIFPFAARQLWSSDRRARMIYIGTYTKTTSKGVYAYRWNSASGEMKEIGLAAETPNPSFLTFSPDRKQLFAVNEQPDDPAGFVSAFAIRGASGKLAARNRVPSGGAAPCNLTTDHTGRSLFVANYTSGSMASFRILPSGDLSEHVADIYFKGHSINPSRQKEAHTHCTTISPDNKFLLVNDLGMDRIMVYHFNPQTAQVTPNDPPFYSAIPGSGPRNLTFHPNRRWTYSVNELASTMDCMHWDSVKGTLTRFQNISTVEMDAKQPTYVATVAVHPNGRFLYTSNRGDDSITVFSIDQENGRVALMQRISVEGKYPRHFALDPTGGWLVAANQNSANIVVLKCDGNTGRLSATGRQYALDSPVCVLFA